jgi:hypothetical protein
MRAIFIAILAAACGQGQLDRSSNSTATSSSGELPSDGTACGNLAVAYHAAFETALACDLQQPDACTEQRPLTVGEVPNGGNTKDAHITGLCWTAYVGYLAPGNLAPLDAALGRYQSAGCSVSFCPGPAPHATRCVLNAQGKPTCGGF